MTATTGFVPIDELVLGTVAGARIYEHGWQSWSPSGLYPVTGTSPRPRRERWQTMAFRPERPAPESGFQGEGLLAVVHPDGRTRVYVAPDPGRQIPSIRASISHDLLTIAADAPVVWFDAMTLDRGLAEVARLLTTAIDTPALRPLGPGWCSWYGYWHEVTDAVVDENLAAMDRLGLDIGLVQIDDGHQADIGDWLEPSGRIASLRAVAARIHDTGREAGLWTAPFLVGARSRLAQEHPEWLVRDAIAAPEHWGQPVHVLDVTHPDAADHLASTFRTLRSWGFTFHKIDFLYGGAMVGGRHGQADPTTAYREGLRIIRDALGPGATILGCGAPLLPSIGLVDAMRISPDIDHRVEPPEGDISQPSQRSALAAGRARAWMHGRLWVNDPDCLIVGPDMEERSAWASHLDAYGGLTISSDRLAELDTDGLALTRRLLRPSSPTTPRWEPGAGPDGGRIVRVAEEIA